MTCPAGISNASAPFFLVGEKTDAVDFGLSVEARWGCDQHRQEGDEPREGGKLYAGIIVCMAPMMVK